MVFVALRQEAVLGPPTGCYKEMETIHPSITYHLHIQFPSILTKTPTPNLNVCAASSLVHNLIKNNHGWLREFCNRKLFVLSLDSFHQASSFGARAKFRMSRIGILSERIIIETRAILVWSVWVTW